MSLIEFRDHFEEKLHAFLWRQWSALGVAGAGAGEDRWILDPEALLLFTLESARSEPRLFDEVLDWLLTNGERIDVQRLRNLADEDKEYPVALLAAVASLLADHETSAKWSRMARSVPDPAAKKVPLFQLRTGASMPPLRSHDPHFEKAGYLRSPFKRRELSQPIPLGAGSCVRFRLRAFFGIGIRAEAAIHLLTHPESHADDVARAIGYSLPGVQQVLREMGESGLIHARREGREKRYWLERQRWSEFLDLRLVDTQRLAARSKEPPEEGIPSPPAVLQLIKPEVAWVQWARLYRGLARILRHFRQPGWEDLSDYMRFSEFVRTVESARDDLEGAERGFHLPPREGGTLETQVSVLEHALDRLI